MKSRSIEAAWNSMTPEKREAFEPHLLGTTSADWLSDWLKRNGTPVSATTIRTYRRFLAKGVVV